MEDKIKKSCTKCRKNYLINGTNVPLFLPCGHSMCEICVKTSVYCSEPVECAICHQNTQVSAENYQSLTQNELSVYSLFPINTQMVGELTLLSLQGNDDNDCNPINDFYVKIEELMKINSETGKCVQCHKPTTMMCRNCDIIVCKDCFHKSHDFIAFQNHSFSSIVPRNKIKNNCPVHSNKTLEYYCKDCSKAICMDCFMITGGEACHGHFIVSIRDQNIDLYIQLNHTMPKVDEIFRRLTNTAKEIGNALTRLHDENGPTAYPTLLRNINANFSKLNYIIQKQKNAITRQVLQNRAVEINSLQSAKSDVTEILFKAQALYKAVELLDRERLQEVNYMESLTVLLEEAINISNAAWCLRQEEVEQPVRVVVKEDVYTSLNDYIQLEGQANSEYRLISSEALTESNEEIPEAPVTIVYPSEHVEDFTQEILVGNTIKKKHLRFPLNFDETPEYSSRSSSSTSFNSSESSSSNEAIQPRDNNPEEAPVSPVPQLTPQEPLNKGWKELVYISHFEDPQNFYVHRASQRLQAQDLKEEFKNGIFYDRPPENYVTEGKILLCYNHQENFWQRCRVLGTEITEEDTTLYNVFCFDFGTTDIVEIDSIRCVPPGRIESPPPLAINCSMVNCDPIDESWTNSDNHLIERIIDFKQIVIHIKDVNYLPTGLMKVECDVTTFEDGISLAHALAFHGRAVIPEDMPHPAAHMFAVWKKPKIFKDDYKISIADVVITHIACPEHFYVRKLNLQPAYEKLCEDLEKVYRFTNKNDIIYLPEKSMACVALVQGYGLGTRWARGVVLELQVNSTVRVLLTDIGAIVEIHWRDLRRIHKKFTVQLGYATECYLYGLMPRNNQWCVESTELLETFQNKPLEMHVKDISNRSSIGIELFDKNDNENIICINEEMVKNKFAINFGCNRNTEANVLVFSEESSIENQILKEREAKARGLKFEVHIINYESPSLMYVSFDYTQKLYSELFEIVNILTSNTQAQRGIDWNVGDKCCTIYEQSQTWRRAVILELENENAKIFYSDFATVETVPVSNLREIHQKLARICDAAVLCHLHGVMPAEGEEWPSLTKEFLKDLMDKYNELYVTRAGAFKGESLPVELWVKETIEGDESEPNNWEWLSLNKQIIEQGLGIPDKKDTENKRVPYGAREKQTFYKISPDTTPIAPMVIKALKVEFNELLSEASSMASENDTSYEEPQASNIFFISDWSPPDPLPNKEFTAMPTHISHNGVIYLHDITQEETLELIRKALEVCFTHPDPEAKFEKWSVGEPCIAAFTLDNRFYRGKVLKVNNKTSTCLIHYIDYGNEELVGFENLRKSIVLHQIPTLAHTCILNRIRPVNNHWNPQSLNYIYKTIIKKQCYVKLSGPPIGGLIPIEIKYNNIWINDHLVGINMALYADGSQPVARKVLASVKRVEQSLEIPDTVVFDETASRSFYLRKSNNDNNWIHIPDGELRQSICENTMCYSPYTKTKFTCYLNVLNEPEILDLTIIHDAKTAKAYENMFKDLQKDGKNMPGLTTIYQNKACVVRFRADNQWYRAAILQSSDNKKLLKVKYVDFGNVEIVNLADVREISGKYAKLPPSTLTVTLHGVKINPDIEKDELIEYYKGIFFDKGPFYAKVINQYTYIPTVELRNDGGQLIYEPLIDQNILLKCDEPYLFYR